MNIRNDSKWWIVTVVMIFGTGFGQNQATALQPSPPDVEPGVQVLTRGPVHEAFAATITFDAEPGIEEIKSPPDPIEEMPPNQKPEGANVTWIAGYWAWDDEQDDFLWVSGIWQDLPPGRQWVPGYWSRSGPGFQWISGYWADAQVSEIEYLPEPPGTVEVGPNIVAPSLDHSWVPGCWVWHDGRYAWRPGYWTAMQPDWVWIPAHYVYAPRGYVFVDGYWDYSVERRGVLFAPVYFESVVYTQPHYSYSPSFAINLNVFSDSLFLRPHYNHYYFGDYYAATYVDSGFYASFSYHSSGYGYDPIYVHHRWQHRQEPDWQVQVVTEFQHRRDYEEARPPRTLALQIELNMRKANSGEKTLVVARSLDQVAKSQDSPVRFKSVDPEERQLLKERGREVRRFREERQKVENETPDSSATEKPSRESRPTRVKLPRSPIVARSADALDKNHAPPKRLEAPKPDPKVEPKPKKIRVQPSPSRERTESKDSRSIEGQVRR